MIEAKDVKDWKTFIRGICWWAGFCLDFASGCSSCLNKTGFTIQSPKFKEK